MRLVIDYNKCRRTGQCSYLHPELFKTDEVGAPVVLVERPGEALRAAAEEAAECCPSGTIALLEEDWLTPLAQRSGNEARIGPEEALFLRWLQFLLRLGVKRKTMLRAPKDDDTSSPPAALDPLHALLGLRDAGAALR